MARPPRKATSSPRGTARSAPGYTARNGEEQGARRRDRQGRVAAALNACSSISRASPDSPAPLACERRAARPRTAAVAARPEAAATFLPDCAAFRPRSLGVGPAPPHARPVRSPAGRHHVRPPAAGEAANVSRRRGASLSCLAGRRSGSAPGDWWFGPTVSENGAVTPVAVHPGSPRPALVSAVDDARAVLVEGVGDAEVGDHLGYAANDERVW